MSAAAQESHEEAKDEGSLPAFDEKEVIVVFVLGGPGAGKGTQCAKIVEEYGCVHLSAGDLLRAEQSRTGSQYGEMINAYITEGKIVPMEVTVALLRNAMQKAMDENHAHMFLIDGFPRKLDQAHKFEKDVCNSRFTLLFSCSEETMEKRLMNRARTSGRADDNPESIKKRFRTYLETTMPVVKEMERRGKVVKVECEDSPDSIYQRVTTELRDGLHLQS